jgi:hypothetical protein
MAMAFWIVSTAAAVARRRLRQLESTAYPGTAAATFV